MNLLTESAFKRLNLVKYTNRTSVVGIGNAAVKTMGRATLDLWHRKRNSLIATTEFVIMGDIEMCHPQMSFPSIELAHIEEEELADPSYNAPGVIDGVIGVTMLSEQMRLGIYRASMNLIVQEMTFGWIVFGGYPRPEDAAQIDTIGVVTASDVYALVRKLWEIEEVNERPSMTTTEIECEELYKRTVVKGEFRYSVTLLLKPDATLGDSRAMARRRFYQLESRLQKSPELRSMYVQFMQEYEALGHMVEAGPLNEAKLYYYVPHHAVAIDRKFRVVFDASAKTTNGKSLNDIQYIGPRQQKDLMDIVMAFRTGRIAMTADIKKMFRQINVHQEQWDLQRILWRASPSEPIREYWLTVVTYGMASSPFNAVRTLRQCAMDNSTEFPRAALVAQNDFYVDDLLTSVEAEEAVIGLKNELIAMLSRGGFELAKWRSNCASVMTEQIESKLVEEQSSTSVLGILWNYASDEFSFKVTSRMQPDVITKRITTSEAARIFDPQGYVMPVTIRAKLFIQELWRTKMGWDEPLPEEFQNEWKDFVAEIRAIEEIRIPRWLGTASAVPTQVHVFCDASTKAYGAVVYVRTKHNGVWSAKLLCSKSKVAPLKLVTVPRLELMALELGTKLLTKVDQVPRVENAPIYVWTDSEISLCWIQKLSNELKTFVANRVTQILQAVKASQVRHVRSEDNPADLLSRGVKAASLINNSLWWNGPSMLGGSCDDWPIWQKSIVDPVVIESTNQEVKRQPARFDNVFLTTATMDEEEIDLMHKFSSHRKTCRVTSYIFRFCRNMCQSLKIHKRKTQQSWQRLYDTDSWKSGIMTHVVIDQNEYDVDTPSVVECQNALKYWIRLAQQETFPNEYDAVGRGECVSRRSALWTLTPQIDEDGLLRIYGRLRNTSLPKDEKHPIILHRNMTVAKRIAKETHELLCHGGVQLCTQSIRTNYWIVGIRVLLRSVVFSCVTCTRYRQQPAPQFMADLPPMRLHATPAFHHTGIDYAGPIKLKEGKKTVKTRSSEEPDKGYIAVFVCMVYKAIHLEVVSDMSTSSFIAALTRFVNLRAGCVRHIYSDNGTNFVGAAKELKRRAETWQDQEVSQYLETHAIQWHFNTPFAPHHGGLWEAAVKSTKTHLRKMAGAHLFTYEELSTLLAKIRACLNSRPLTPVSSDPSDLTALTPSHFLSARPIISPLEEYVGDVPMNRLTAWQKITKLQQEFWERWTKEYISELQSRNKWAKLCDSVQIGELVLLKNELLPPSQWLLGRIVATYPGPDGRVRSCRVKTIKGNYDRPVTKLCRLPIDSDEANASETGFCP